MKAEEVKVGLKVRSVTHPKDHGEVTKVLFEGRGAMVLWNEDAEAHPALASLLKEDLR